MAKIRNIGICLIIAFTLLILPVFAQNSQYLIDDADLLTDGEESSLYAYLSHYSDLHNIDIVIVTTNSTGGQDIMDYADDYFDYNGYGRGSGADGVILVVDMGGREVWISTSGSAISAMTDAGIDLTLDDLTPYLSNGDYNDAFESFIASVNWLYEQYEAGTPYYVGSGSSGEVNWFWVVVLGLGIGFIISLMIVGGWKNQLTPVAMKVGAQEYIVKDSFQLSESSDMFLYRNVSRRARPKESSGGSSTHTSSSGHSHGGGGRGF